MGRTNPSLALPLALPENAVAGTLVWPNSYYVGTTGGVALETVKRYVESQKGE